MGTGARLIALALGGAGLAACRPDAVEPVRNAQASAAEPAPSATAPPAPVAAAEGAPSRDWLVGAWSFEQSCATDFIARYEADGRLDNSGEVGRWSLAGDTITETIHERPDEEGAASVKVNPPEIRDYSVARIDRNHGTITYQGRKVPMLRC